MRSNYEECSGYDLKPYISEENKINKTYLPCISCNNDFFGQLQDLATTLLELWHLMDTPMEEQQLFQNVTCNIAASEDEINEPNSLSVDAIDSVSTSKCPH